MKLNLSSVLVLSLVFTASQAMAGVFSPVADSQVPSGLTYAVKQPPVESSRLFTGKRIAILASHGVEESEITYPHEYLARRGARVDVLVPSWTADGIVASQFLKPTVFVKASGTFKEGMTRDYDLVVLTGGAWNAQVVRTDDDALALVRNQVRMGKPLAAICAGTIVLVNAGLADRLQMTGSPTVRLDLENAGAHYVDSPLVVGRTGGSVIATSRSPNDLPEFVEGLKTLLLEH